MDLKKDLEKDNLERDIISEIYHNNLEELQMIEQSKEYIELSKKIKSTENMLLKEFKKENVKKYIEYINERNSIEAENQFKLGFKLAIRIILDTLR